VRRIVLVLLLVAAFVVAGYMLLRPKPKTKSARAKSSKVAVGDATGQDVTAKPAGKVAKSGSKSSKAGKVAGTLKASSKEERRVQMKKIKDEERRRKKALKQQERDKRRLLKGASARGGRRKASKGTGFYVLKAIILLGDQSYVLVDGRKARVGDVVMGRKIVEIGQDRIEIEAFGRRSTVRVGESLLPISYSPSTSRKK
jgi:hypothetical protein